MKRLLFLFIFLASFLQLSAQYFRYFPHGLTIPDVTYYDFYTFDSIGHLYGEVADGKTLIVFSFDHYDTLAWNFHDSGELQSLYAQYGPGGSNQIKVIMIPYAADEEGLMGQYPTSPGNWLANMPYPVHVSGYLSSTLHDLNRPFLFCLCPDKRAFKLPFVSADSLATYIGHCESATVAVDAKVVQTDMDTTASCAGQLRPMDAYLSNMGTDTLTDIYIVTTSNGEVVGMQYWQGSLATYEYEKVQLPPLPTHGYPEDIRIFTKLPNGIPDQNPANDTLSVHLGRPVFWDDDKIVLDMQMDVGADYFYWDLKSADYATIDSGGNAYLSQVPWSPGDIGTGYNLNAFVTDTISLLDYPGQGMRLYAVSGRAYGLCCESGEEGYVRVRKGEDVIWDWAEWNWKIYGKLFTTFHLVPLSLSATPLSETNDDNNGSITLSATGGQAPYQYSIDCGQTYVSSNEFTGLAAGLYCVEVMDSIGQVVMDSVEVMNITGTEAAIYGRAALSVQPNPSEDVMNIHLAGGSVPEQSIRVQLYDATGRHVRDITLTRQGEGTYTGTVSLADLPEGVYVLRSSYAPSVRVVKG